MQGKVGLEEHFAITETVNDSLGFLPERLWSEMRARLLDFHDERLRQMDKHGIEITVLSLNAPAVQAIPDAKLANEIARKANDLLAEQVAKRPDRFAALAAVRAASDGFWSIRRISEIANHTRAYGRGPTLLHVENR